MNTAVKIKSCTRASASAKVAYNEERQKNKKRDIVVLEKNEMPQQQTLTLTSEQQKEYRKAQKDLSCYQKRLEKAILENKEKSIATNQKNIEKAKAILAKYENRQDKREKYFVEFTIALTNSKNEQYDKNWSKKTLDYIKQEFKELDVISAVEHRDQHSPHMHIVLHSKEKTVTQVLAQYANQKDTSRESMKEAYSTIAHKFHSFANENIAHNRLETLKKSRKYVSLGQYKQKGNFEAKNALESNLNYLLEKKEKLESKSREINIEIENEYRHKVNFEVIDKSKSFWFKEYSFVTVDEIERKDKNTKEFLKSVEKFDIDIKDETKEIEKHFEHLLTAKRSKDRVYEHWDKEAVVIVDKENFKKFLESLNSNIKKIHEKIKELYEKTQQELQQIREKIYQHPETRKQRELEQKREIEIKKLMQEKRERQKLQDREKNRGFER